MFDAESLKKHVEETLKPVPAEHKNAIVGFVNSQGEVKLTYARRIGEHGEFGVVVERERLKGFNAGAFVKATW